VIVCPDGYVHYPAQFTYYSNHTSEKLQKNFRKNTQHMGYRTLRECVVDLEKHGHLIRCEDRVDAILEVAEIQRRVYANDGPAILFTNVDNSPFPLVSNLFGSLERSRFMFRDTWERVQRLIAWKADPAAAVAKPWQVPGVLRTAWTTLPKRRRNAASLAIETQLDQLPQMTSWPDDGGPFITLPQVYTEMPGSTGWQHSNLGMYRVQLSGQQYAVNREVGLHYQIHRGIGVHHTAALQRGERLPVSVFVGGSPAMTLAAVMPLPEGLSELIFAGALAGHRIPLTRQGGLSPAYSDADFCIRGSIDPPRTLPEGPFGDHLGYYSLVHDFPVLEVDRVTHRHNPIWPFTVVGRPPQEDTAFGALIHELTGPIIPTVLPGVKGVHAVDAAGVHPLLLAIGSERYTPYQKLTAPQELLTQANAILGQGQMSLAKYLFIIDGAAVPELNIHDIPSFMAAVLRRVDWQRDLHFQTKTTIDTLDYSGSGLNQGSKVVVAAAGEPIRELASELPSDFRLPGFENPQVCAPGILAVQTNESKNAAERLDMFAESSGNIGEQGTDGFPLIVVVDDANFVARTFNNFLWSVFTRSNPARDIYGIGASTQHKHWGCSGSLAIDARIKPHHAPPLIESLQVLKRIDSLATKGSQLAKYL